MSTSEKATLSIADMFPNDLDAQYKYAKKLFGKGDKITKKEIDIVLNWTLIGVERKYPPALCLLAQMYRDGVGVPKDADKQDECYLLAHTFYKEGGFVGDIETLRSLATTFEFVKRQYLRACELYALGAAGDTNDAQCQYRAGSLFYNSTIGLSGYEAFSSIPLQQRRQLAVSLFTEASNQNHLDATTLLAELYELGRCGLSIDKQKARELYAKGAELYKAEIERYKKENNTGMLTVAQTQYDHCSQKVTALTPKQTVTANTTSTTYGAKATGNNGAKTKKKVPSPYKRMLVGLGIVILGGGFGSLIEGITGVVDIGMIIFGIVLTVCGGWILINRIRFGVCDEVEVDDTTTSSSSSTHTSYSSSSSYKASSVSSSSSSAQTKAKKWKLCLYGSSYGTNYEIENGSYSRLDITRNGTNTGYEFAPYDGSIYDGNGKEIARLVGYKQTWGEYDTTKSGGVNYYSDYNGEQLFSRWEVVEDK